MPTEKLYWADPMRSSFDARGGRASSFDGRPSLVLPATLFYPEGGGQLGDTGSLAADGLNVRIVDTQIDEHGDIHHILEEPPPPGAAAGELSFRGTVDEARRRDHMAQHTAQHMLSRALIDVARADTVSSRLGATSCTIDVSQKSVRDDLLYAAEDRVNAAIRDDVIVRSLFPTPEELATMKLRRQPKVASGIRIIDVEGFDQTPCGGTHCTRTGQIGSVTIERTEAYKGTLRLSFHAAGRATRSARETGRVLADLAADFTCGPLDVPAAVRKLRSELKARLDAMSGLRGELVELLAERVLAAHPPDPSGTTRIVLLRPQDDQPMLRTLAGRLAARPDVVAFCASVDPESKDLLVVVQRGASASFDCATWFKAVAARAGGRGGGRPERAEGRLSPEIDLEAEAGRG